MNNIIVMFPGQGSQYVGLGKKWFDQYDSVKACFKQASEITGYPLKELCFEGPLNELTKTNIAQVAVLTTSYAMYEVLQKEKEIPVTFFTGHSLGEITALTAAGAMKFADAVKLVKVRGESMAACAEGLKTGMSAIVKLSVDVIEPLLKEFNEFGHDVQIANYNSEFQTVLAGKIDELNAFAEIIDTNGGRVVRMNVGGAFHSSYMQGAVKAYSEEIERIEFKMPQIPVISSVTGKVYSSVEEIKETLSKQLTSPVCWSSVIDECEKREVKMWLEVGPKNVLTKLVRKMVDNSEVLTFEEDSENGYKVIDTVIKLKMRDPSFIQLCMGVVASTKNRNWDELDYSQGVIQKYKQLQELQGKYEENEITLEKASLQALEILKVILNTKKVPVQEQKERIRGIIKKANSSIVYQ